MKHVTAAELGDRIFIHHSDNITVFDEEAMVVEQSLYQDQTSGEETTQTHADDEVYFIASGSGTIRVGAETSEVSPGDVIYVDGGVEHGFFDIDEEIRALKVFASA
ncbi:hypothetical protein JCM18237_15950 [Halorubrum luteum]